MPVKRIVSLLPAATEIICALGLEEQLAGRSHECNYPAGVKRMPVCTSTALPAGSDSRSIDKQVKEILSEGLSVYQIDKELIRQLVPDVIITQTQCDACAVSEKDMQNILKDIIGNDIQLVSLHPNMLEDIYRDIKTIAAVLDAGEKGNQLLEELQERIELIRHKLKFIDKKPKTACIEWLSPLMAAGNWMPELVETAGGMPVLAESGKHSPYIEAGALTAANPEVILIAPCGFMIPQTLQEIHLLAELPGWNELDAVKNNQVYIADGSQFFNRPGPRIVDSIEMLAEILNPKQFAFGYEGEGWTKFDFTAGISEG